MCSEGQSSPRSSVRDRGALREHQIHALPSTDDDTLDQRGEDNCPVLHSICIAKSARVFGLLKKLF